MVVRLANWAEKDGTGVCFGADTGFTLPNGTRRGPDGSWMLLDRWNRVPEEQREKLAPLCPDLERRLPACPPHRLRFQQHFGMLFSNGEQF
jgi:hypothetical protein